MATTGEILCIGSVLWDVIGRSNFHMKVGSDVPGRIERIPGGVALNIAMTLRRFGMQPQLLSAIGRDAEGDDLVRQCLGMGLGCDHLYRSDDLPTDVYMAVEGANGLVAAIADAHSLEQAGDKILRPLTEGALGRAQAPYPGLIALDGNLTEALLADIAASAAFSRADLRIAPASPGKAARLLPLLGHGAETFYVNKEEAGILASQSYQTAEAAAEGLVARGARRVLVTDGAGLAAEAGPSGVFTAKPPEVMVTRVTGAGDTFMAAHIASEASGAAPHEALAKALAAAAAYVSGEAPA